MLKRNESQPKKQSLIPSWSLPLILCVVALRVASMIYDRGFSSYDDGVAAEGAKLLLLGKAPYRDFWTMYSPGSYYVNALGLAVLGERLANIRMLAMLQAGVQALLLYAILKRTARSIGPAVAAAVVFLALIPLGTLNYWLTIVMAAAYCVLRAVEQPHSKWTYACGAAISLAALFRQDVGAYLLIGALPFVYAASSGRGLRRFTPALRVVCMSAVVVGIAVAYIAARGALAPMLDQAVRFAIIDYPGSRPLPYPVPWHEVLVIGPYFAPMAVGFVYQLYGFYLMPAVLLFLTIVSARRLTKNANDRQLLLACCLLGLALVMFLMVRIRPSGARIVAAAALGSAAFAAIVGERDRLMRLTAIAAMVASVIAFVPFAVYSVWAERAYAPSIIAGRGGVYAAAGHAESLTVVSARVKALTSPSERILAGAPIIYFLADRQPATRNYEPHPRWTDTRRIQRQTIRDMERDHVRYFVRSREWGHAGYFTIEPNNQPRALIDYIERNYRVREDYTVFQIYERKTPFESASR